MAAIALMFVLVACIVVLSAVIVGSRRDEED